MIKLMTLNLWGYEQWDTREKAVLSLMKKQSPDIIALQEVRFDMTKAPTSQAAHLASKGSFPYVIYTPSLREGRRPRQRTLTEGYSHGLALLSKYPVVSSELYHLSQGFNFDEPCSTLFATININGQMIDICNVHFGNADQESNEHLEELVKLCVTRGVQPVVMGDFNIFKLAKHSNNTLLENYTLSSDELDYISVPKNNGTLDYVVIPEKYSFKSVTCPEDEVSDHRAVVTEIETNKNNGKTI